ncbi:hypothetical protein Dform_01296 [Dehalogenimonas formicexedens]|uniref:Uncharacterized protein n=1 Tax=Dehalogenimonas formicexedens TaxID=1839801 RepID=A0A1P8F822_9CHLR|nr:hypothetical protein [Dehalogenimonas formicexedens]APV44624.1 hypothetical protein Dform_01296 [Dehalogenimonas formicexedens]
MIAVRWPKKLIREEKGVTFILALIVLAVGSLIMVPMLSFMASGLAVGTKFENKTEELYAADAGVADAVWQIKNGTERVPVNQFETLGPYYLNNDDSSFRVNNQVVKVSIQLWDQHDRIYKVVSEATNPSGKKTTVQTYVTPSGLPIIFTENAITSPGNVSLGSNATVNGPVMYNGFMDNKGTITGDITKNPIPNWPYTQPNPEAPASWVPPTSGDQVAYFYWQQVKNLSPLYYPDSKITVAPGGTIGPLFRYGDLEIQSDTKYPTYVSTDPTSYTTLNGTIFVNGDFKIAENGQKNPIINLNGNTIYVNGSVSIASAIKLVGAGCIIAKGDIDFYPNTSAAGFIFIMSIEGTTQLKPNGDFMGSVAGAAEVELQPGAELVHPSTFEPPNDVVPPLNVPDFATLGGTPDIRWKTLLWEVTVS